MKPLRSLGMLSALAVLCACQSPEPTNVRPVSPRVAHTASAEQAGWMPEAAQPSPLAPTPLPSGHTSPLPRTAFPADPSPSPVPSGTSVLVGPSPTPAATAPPAVPVPTLQPAAVLSNTLLPGTGAVGGIIVDVPHNATPVAEATVTIRSADDPTHVATLRNAGDGTYRLDGLALGTYYVQAQKDGYAGDTAGLSVTLSPSSAQLGTVNLVLVKL